MFNGQALKAIRESMGLSQQYVADLLGVSKVSVHYYEKGFRIPGLKQYIKLLEIFGFNYAPLINMEVKDEE